MVYLCAVGDWVAGSLDIHFLAVADDGLLIVGDRSALGRSAGPYDPRRSLPEVPIDHEHFFSVETPEDVDEPGGNSMKYVRGFCWDSQGCYRSVCLGILGLLVMNVLMSGCAFVRGEVGEPFSEEGLQTVKPGKTSRQEVDRQFGAPDEIVQANGHEIFHYRRFDSKMGWLLFLSRLNIGSDHLWVFFNEQGVVDDVVFGNRTKDVEFQIWPFGD